MENSEERGLENQEEQGLAWYGHLRRSDLKEICYEVEFGCIDCKN